MGLILPSDAGKELMQIMAALSKEFGADLSHFGHDRIIHALLFLFHGNSSGVQIVGHANPCRTHTDSMSLMRCALLIWVRSCRPVSRRHAYPTKPNR